MQRAHEKVMVGIFLPLGSGFATPVLRVKVSGYQLGVLGEQLLLVPSGGQLRLKIFLKKDLFVQWGSE